MLFQVTRPSNPEEGTLVYELCGICDCAGNRSRANARATLIIQKKNISLRMIFKPYRREYMQ
jgi:hypothetical protein